MRWIGSFFCLGIYFADALTIKVDGEGYLRFFKKNGDLVYQKEAEIKVTNGILTNQGGDSLAPTIHVPKGTSSFKVDLNGVVSVPSGSDPVGQLVLAICNEKKQDFSQGVFTSNGRVKLGNPGDNEWGVIRMIKPGSIMTKGDIKSTAVSLPEIILDFKNEVEVEEDQFTLGELVKDDLPPHLKKIILGETPPFGATRSLNCYQIESRMKLAGHNFRDFKSVLPTQIRVKRKSQPVLHEQICQFVFEESKKQLGEVELAPGCQPTMNVPLGDLSFALESLKGYKNSWTAIVGIYVDGKRFNGRSIQIIRSGIGASIQVGQMVKIILRSNGVLVETKGKLKNLKGREAHVEYGPNTIVEGVLKNDGSIEVTL